MSDTVPLPTRLIDLGEREAPTMTLYQTREYDSLKYIALSRPWGEPPLSALLKQPSRNTKRGSNPVNFLPPFRMRLGLLENLDSSTSGLTQSVSSKATTVTSTKRPKKKQMDDVFSTVSCILAVSSASGQNDGFLKNRDEREYLTIVREGLPPFYVCRFIDDFNEHVLEGSLNKRGWVLQERALAHRTIYFTNK